MSRFSCRIPEGICLFAALLELATGLRAQALAPALPNFGAFTLLDAEIIDANNNYSFPNAQQFGFGTLSFSTPTDPVGSGGFSMRGSVLGGTNPSVNNSTTETVLMDPGYQAGTSSTAVSYYFEVVGPAVTTVPVDLAADLSDSWSSNLSSGGGFLDAAQLGVYDPEGNTIGDWTIDDQGGATGGETLTVDQTIELSSDTIYNVYETTNATLQLAFGSTPVLDGTYAISVSIDPAITIDPSFQLAGYSLEESPNLLTSTIPEKADTLSLLALSLVVLVLLRNGATRGRPSAGTPGVSPF